MKLLPSRSTTPAAIATVIVRADLYQPSNFIRSQRTRAMSRCCRSHHEWPQAPVRWADVLIRVIAWIAIRSPGNAKRGADQRQMTKPHSLLAYTTLSSDFRTSGRAYQRPLAFMRCRHSDQGLLGVGIGVLGPPLSTL